MSSTVPLSGLSGTPAEAGVRACEHTEELALHDRLSGTPAEAGVRGQLKMRTTGLKYSLSGIPAEAGVREIIMFWTVVGAMSQWNPRRSRGASGNIIYIQLVPN